MGKDNITFEDAFQLQRPFRAANGLEELAAMLASIQNINLQWGSGINVVHYYIQHGTSFEEEPTNVVALLKRIGANIECKAHEGLTPLAHAVGLKNVRMVKALLENGAIVDATNFNGSTALFKAVMQYRGEEACIEIITLLVLHGASIDHQNDSGHSPRSMVLRRHQSLAIAKQPMAWDLQVHLGW
jgi:ankyrin repeat protein